MNNIDAINRIFKAYDIRGLVDGELTEEIAFATGSAFALFIQAEREPATVVIGEDMRPTSPLLADAFADGINAQGIDVIRIGLCSTDGLYFASGYRNLPGAMFTASHNPAEYNGIKLCKSGARPIGQETGLAWIKEQVISGAPIALRAPGQSRNEDLLADYVDFLFSLFPSDVFTRSFQGRQLAIAVDAGNGMGGFTVPPVMKRINARLESIYLELDGTFPNHEANPIEPSNMVSLQTLVKKKSCDIGLAFDGDADRCFLVDENGELVSPSSLTALIAERELKRNPGAAIIYNLICSSAVPEVVKENGGTPLRSRVGHSYIKAMMAESGAVFGGEHSGHFYFKDFWRADSGMLAALHAIAAMYDTGKKLSELMEPYNRYALSGEINTKVNDPKASVQFIHEHYSKLDSSLEFDDLDGLTVISPTWRFNVRPSNTEPLLRLNVEAPQASVMASVRDEVLRLLKNQ